MLSLHQVAPTRLSQSSEMRAEIMSEVSSPEKDQDYDPFAPFASGDDDMGNDQACTQPVSTVRDDAEPAASSSAFTIAQPCIINQCKIEDPEV